MSIGGVALVTAAGLASAGYPIAWLALSPKSVLRSPDAAFADGFGAGVAMTVGVIFGVAMLGFAWSQVARRFGPRGRRRLEMGLLVGFFIGLLVVTAIRAAR